MEVKQCPHCNVRVAPTADGRCPSCRREIEQNGDERPPIVNPPPRGHVDARQEEESEPAEAESLSPYAGLAAKIRPQGSVALNEYLSKDPVVVVIRSNESYSTRGAFLTALNLYRLAATSIDFNVLLDGKIVAKLAEGSRFETAVAPGEHTIWVSNALAASKAVSFQVDRGQRVRFACNGKAIGLMLRKVD